MNKAAPLLLLLAALVGAAYFVLGADDPGTGDSATIGRSTSDGVQEEGSTREDPDALTAPALEAAEGDRQGVSAGPKAGSARGPSTAKEEAAAVRESQRGTVIGRVTDGLGSPLAGASVGVTRRGLDDLFSEIRAGSSGPDAGTNVTDAEGRFSVSSRVGAVRLAVEADGFAPYSASVNVAADVIEDVGELRLAPGVILRGRVVDVEDNGVAGASLARAAQATDGITILGEAEMVARCDAGGYFEILRQAPGAYEFHVSHPEHPPATLKGKTQQAGETVTDLRVVMDPGGVIRGVAVGVPAGTDALFAQAYPGDGASRSFSFSTGPERERSAPVQSDGTFEIRGLAAGAPYQIYLRQGEKQAFGDGNRRSQWVGVTVPKDGSGTMVQIPYSLGASVSFTVVDETGAPHLPDTIDAGFDYPQRRENAEKDGATGRCAVRGLWPQAEGQLLQFALAAQGFQKYEAKGLMIYPDDQVDLGQITLEARPSVRVTVLEDATGQPVEGAIVTLMPPPQDEPSGTFRVSARLGSDDEDDKFQSYDPDAVQSGRTDADGVCSLDASAGATVVLRVHDQVHAPSELAPFTLPEQMTVYEQEIRLAPGGGLRVLALDPTGQPASGYSIEFQDDGRDEEDRQTERTGQDGVAEIAGLRTGEHLVRLGKRGTSSVFMPRIRIPGMGDGQDEDEKAWTRVTVLPGEVVNVTLEAPAIGVLVGTVTERNKALGSAKLKLEKAGDEGPMAGLMMFGGAGLPSTTSDARGEFRIIDVEAGEYRLVVEHPTRAMPFSMPVTVEGDEQKVEVDLSVTEVMGRVLDHEGEPLAGATVEASRATEEGAPRRTAVSMVMITSDSGGGAGVMMTSGEDEVEPTTTDAEGRYRLRGVTHGVDLEVRATAKGYDEVKSERFRVGEGGVESDVDLRFAKAGSIRIEVEGRTGPVLARLRRQAVGRGGPPKMEMLRADSTTVDSLGAGKWTVTLQSVNGQALSVDPDEVEVEVVGGETAVASFKIL